MEINDSITKQDLVDYVITKKVEQILELQSEVNKKRKDKENELKNIDDELTDLENKSIKKIYGTAINAIEKSTNSYHLIILNSSIISSLDISTDLKRLLYDMCRGGKVNIVFISKEKKHEIFFTHNRYDMECLVSLGPFESILKVDMEKIVEDKKIKSLREKYNKLDQERKDLKDQHYKYSNDIKNVKNKKDQMKAVIVEQMLEKSEDGLEMLEMLRNINFDDIKFLA